MNSQSEYPDDAIYVRLPDEPVEVYVPVQARSLGDGLYKLEASGDYDPELTRWEFPPGSIVLCEDRQLFGGRVRVAVRRINGH